jgi:hypothetical protein
MNFFGVSADQSLGARQHLLRSAAGEGEQENPLRFDAAVNQVCDSIDQSASLACARAGDYEKRTIAVGCSGCLLRVQIRGEVTLRRRNESLSSGVNADGARVRHWTSNIGRRQPIARSSRPDWRTICDGCPLTLTKKRPCNDIWNWLSHSLFWFHPQPERKPDSD